MDAKTTAKFLQTQLNRYVKVTGLAPLTVDGAIGPATATATKMALNEIVKLASANSGGAQAWKDFHGFAWNYINTVDANNPSTVTAQAYALADLFQKFGNFAGPPILPDQGTPSTSTSVATTTTKPPAVALPVPAPSPVPTVATATSTVNFLGLKLPRIVLYAGGGALALAVVALIATRKPRGSVAVAGPRRRRPNDSAQLERKLYAELERARERMMEDPGSDTQEAYEAAQAKWDRYFGDQYARHFEG